MSFCDGYKGYLFCQTILFALNVMHLTLSVADTFQCRIQTTRSGGGGGEGEGGGHRDP